MGRVMNNKTYLEKIHAENVELDPAKEKLFLEVHRKVLKSVIEAAKKKSPEFKEVYYGKYDGGSYFDGLQVKSDNNDFDINIIFKCPPTTWKITDLGRDQRLPNFACIEAPDQSSDAWRDLMSKNMHLKSIISAKEMYYKLHTAVSKGLTSLDHEVIVQGIPYKVTRKDAAPVVLNVQGTNDVNFKVDLVPAFQLQMKHTSIDQKLKSRVEEVMESASSVCPTFMAINIHKASKDAFELDFHEVERALLKSRGGCIYKVIKLIKYIAKSKGGNFTKLWSHVLKVCLQPYLINPIICCADLSDAPSPGDRPGVLAG